MSFIDEMRNLRKDLESGEQLRRRRVREIKEESSAFLKDAERKRGENFKVLSEGINKAITDLKGSVSELRKGVKATQKGNRARQRELKKELSAASAAFWGKEKPKEKKFKEGGE